MSDTKPLMYNMSGAAKRLGITYPLLKRLIEDGFIKTIKYPGYSPRVSEKALEDFICLGENNHLDSGNEKTTFGTSNTTALTSVRAHAAAQRLKSG